MAIFTVYECDGCGKKERVLLGKSLPEWWRQVAIHDSGHRHRMYGEIVICSKDCATAALTKAASRLFEGEEKTAS